MSESVQDQMLFQLQRMNRLLALVATRGLEMRDAVPTLVHAGYTHSEAGSILGLTKNAVFLQLRRIKDSQKGSRSATSSRRNGKARKR
jgi:hypothetical protein